jgi:MFS transporter, DHA3 family, macrolide efflux protein
MKLNKEFYIFQAAVLLSIAGNAAIFIALSWWIIKVTGSATEMSLILLPSMIARIVLTPLLGPLGDKINRKKLIIIANTFISVVLMFLGIMAFKNIFTIKIIAGIFTIQSIGVALQISNLGSYISNVVKQEHLSLAIRYNKIIVTFGNIAGSTFGGLLLTIIGVANTFFLIAFIFFISALLLLFIRKEVNPQIRIITAKGFKNAVIDWQKGLISGLNLVFKIKVLFYLAFVFMFMNLFLAPMGIILPVLTKDFGNLPPWYLGLLQTSLGVGSVIAGLLLGKISKFLRNDLLIVISLIIAGLALIISGSFYICSHTGSYTFLDRIFYKYFKYNNRYKNPFIPSKSISIKN